MNIAEELKKRLTALGQDPVMIKISKEAVEKDYSESDIRDIATDGIPYIEDGTVRIGKNAMRRYPGSFYIASSVISIGDYALCNSGYTFALPKTVEHIGMYALEGTPYMERLCKECTDGFIVINNILVKYIGNDSIVKVPDGIVTIGAAAFENCRSVTEVILPSSVKTIDKYAFFGCRKLEKINIPDAVFFIGEHAFEYCENLRRIELPIGFEEINDCTFRGCANLEYAAISNKTRHIGKCAFEYCRKLADIDIRFLFMETDVNFHSDTSYFKRNLKQTVESVAKEFGGGGDGNPLSESMEFIDDYAFAYCSSLTKMHIPHAVKYIGKSAFMNCSALDEVSLGSHVAICKDAFEGTPWGEKNPDYVK